MLPPSGQDETDNRARPRRITPGVPGRALLVLRHVLLLGLLILVTPPAVLWRLIGFRRIWPRIFFLGFCAIVGLRPRVHGTPRGNALYLPNHVSWMDIPAILATTGSAFVAHDGLTGSRLFKFLADLNDTVFIARNHRATIGTQIEEVRHAVAGDDALTIFIEGTTSDGTHLLPFKSALLSALEPLPEGLTIQPVLLRYADGPSVAWVGDDPGGANFGRMLARWRPIRLDLYFLDPLTGDALQNRKTMAAAAHDAIAARMAAG